MVIAPAGAYRIELIHRELALTTDVTDNCHLQAADSSTLLMLLTPRSSLGDRGDRTLFIYKEQTYVYLKWFAQLSVYQIRIIYFGYIFTNDIERLSYFYKFDIMLLLLSLNVLIFKRLIRLECKRIYVKSQTHSIQFYQFYCINRYNKST